MQDYSTKRILLKAPVFFIIAILFLMSPVWAASTYSEIVKAMAKSIASDIAETGKTRVAVARIMSADKKDSQFGLLMTEKLTTGLIQEARSRYSVLERELVDRIMGERVGLTAEEAQQLLEADILITGTYTILANEVDLSIRAIDLSTAKAIAATGNSILLKEVKPLLTPEESKLPSAMDEEITLNLEVLALKYIDRIEREVVVRNGDTLYSGDKLKINLMASRDCHLYVLYYDSLDQAGVLFPNPKIALDTTIRGGVQYSLPGENLRFILDDNVGTETLYFVASLEPMNDISNLLIDMEEAGRAGKTVIGNSLKESMGARGFGIVTSDTPSVFGNRDRVMDIVKGRRTVLKVMEILHR